MMDSFDRRPALAPSIVTVSVHACVWAALLAFVVTSVDGPRSVRLFDDFQMKLPWLTETWFQFAMLVHDFLPVVIGGLGVLLLADLAILHTLSRSDGRRIARELWSGLMIALPVVGIYVSATASNLLYIKLFEALKR